MPLRDYQIRINDEVAGLYRDGSKSIVVQLATGGGKTYTFAGIIDRYLNAFDKNVLILVHREELLKQARGTIYDFCGRLSETLVAGRRNFRPGPINIAMVETAINKLRKNPNYFGDVGLVIIDECHIGNFKKTYKYFPDCLRLGFSATPISASKKDPLKNHYEEIVTGIDIPELIDMGSLMPNETFRVKGVDKSKLSKSRGDYAIGEMASYYSAPKHVHNAIQGYEKHCLHRKTLVFNCNIAHSTLVTQAFNNAGYHCEHLDGSESKADRAAKLKWFKENPRAILCNVGVLTTGFDEPSVECGIINRSTMSLPLWLQMTGRCSRPSPLTGKTHFTIVDMGDNVLTHGDWSQSRDWDYIFHNPDKPKDIPGLAPIKFCEGCDACIPAQTKICKFCGHDHTKEVEYDLITVEFERIVSRVNVQDIINNNKRRNYKDFKAFFDILNNVVTNAKYRLNVPYLTPELHDELCSQFMVKVKEWTEHSDTKYNKWLKDFAREQFTSKINQTFAQVLTA